jgi:hypothetical protein
MFYSLSRSHQIEVVRSTYISGDNHDHFSKTFVSTLINVLLSLPAYHIFSREHRVRVDIVRSTRVFENKVDSVFGLSLSRDHFRDFLSLSLSLSIRHNSLFSLESKLTVSHAKAVHRFLQGDTIRPQKIRLQSTGKDGENVPVACFE